MDSIGIIGDLLRKVHVGEIGNGDAAPDGVGGRGGGGFGGARRRTRLRIGCPGIGWAGIPLRLAGSRGSIRRRRRRRPRREVGRAQNVVGRLIPQHAQKIDRLQVADAPFNCVGGARFAAAHGLADDGQRRIDRSQVVQELCQDCAALRRADAAVAGGRRPRLCVADPPGCVRPRRVRANGDRAAAEPCPRYSAAADHPNCGMTVSSRIRSKPSILSSSFHFPNRGCGIAPRRHWRSAATAAIRHAGCGAVLLQVWQS